MDLPSLALLGVVVVILVARALLRERRDYARFKRMRSTVARQRVFRRWLIDAVIALGGLAIATVVGGWAAIPEVLADAQRWAPIAASREFLASGTGIAVAIGAGVAVLAALVVPPLLARGSTLDDIPAAGDVKAIIPRSLGELRYGAALSVNAGVSEELLFRLGLPALAYAVTGDAVVAFAGAAVLFGMLHLYQGPVGVVFTGVLGVVFTALYLVTGSILVPIVLHAFVDLRSMVLLPVALGAIKPLPARPPAVEG